MSPEQPEKKEGVPEKQIDSDNLRKLKDCVPESIARVYPAPPDNRYHLFFEENLYNDIFRCLHLNSFRVTEFRDLETVNRVTVKKYDPINQEADES